MQGKLDNFDLLLPDWLYYTPKRKAGAPSQAARPGFMLVVTANSISMEGRDLIGPAFRGRLNCHTMPVPNACDMLAIIKEKALALDEDAQVMMAEDLARIIADGCDFSLRDVAPEIPAIAEAFFGLKPLVRPL